MAWIGIAGWDYADWSGPVYPARASRRFDRLAWISRFVDLIEVNSSFYRPVAPAVAESWIRRTEDRPRLRFTAKAHRSWTHNPDAEPGAAVDATLAGLTPLRDAGKLGALLLQFPQSFHFEPGALDRLERLLDAAEGWPLVAEVRHRSWAHAEAEAWFSDHGLGWCAVDQPQVGDSTIERLPRVTSKIGYLRLHGRNTGDWFRPGAGRDARYDYRYGRRELREVATQIAGMANEAGPVYVVQNNHFRGQALVNALELRGIVEGVPPLAPGRLVATYPDLADAVRVEREGLF